METLPNSFSLLTELLAGLESLKRKFSQISAIPPQLEKYKQKMHDIIKIKIKNKINFSVEMKVWEEEVMGERNG